MGKKLEKVKTNWRRIKGSPQFHNVLMFLIFVAIAAVFWFIVALNDNVTETYKVRLVIQNVPDSVTFINDPPTEFHVTLRDKGTNILRSGVIKNPTVSINFHEYAHDGILRLTPADLSAQMKADLGGVAQISSATVDSIRCYYTTGPGKRVPVIVRSDVSAASGYIISSAPMAEQKSVLIYSYRDEIDTVHQVYTNKLVKKDLSQTSVFPVKVVNMAGIKIVPNVVDVKVAVEPLVHKEVYVPVDILNLPEGENLLLFPARVPVSFFVPMSRFNDEDPNVHVMVDYNDIKSTQTAMLPVRITASANHLVNVELKADSVEYTLVRQ